MKYYYASLLFYVSFASAMHLKQVHLDPEIGALLLDTISWITGIAEKSDMQKNGCYKILTQFKEQLSSQPIETLIAQSGAQQLFNAILGKIDYDSLLTQARQANTIESWITFRNALRTPLADIIERTMPCKPNRRPPTTDGVIEYLKENAHLNGILKEHQQAVAAGYLVGFYTRQLIKNNSTPEIHAQMTEEFKKAISLQ